MRKSSQLTAHRSQLKLSLLTSVFCFLVSVLCGCQSRHLYRDTRLLMGTIVEVVSSDKRAADVAFKEIERIENLLSFYKNDSETSLLNTQGKIEASPETVFVIKKAGEFWKATKGAFDVTMAPLLELWGFPDRNYRIPGDSEIRETLELIGFDKVKINDNIIEFKVRGMKIDLGAIAKGYAVDCAVKKLKLAGINIALINAGGDIYCLGDKNGTPWRIAIKAGQSTDYAGYLKLKDKAVATSGNYEWYFDIGNTRYCHIMNPATGKPVDSGVVSVSVIADDCLTADALATSIFVLGKEKGMALAKEFGAEAEVY